MRGSVAPDPRAPFALFLKDGRGVLSREVVVFGGLAEVEIIFRKDGLNGGIIRVAGGS